MELAADWNQPVPLSTKLVMVLADLEERKKLAFSPSFSAAEYVLYIESMYSCGTIASFGSSLWWSTIGCEDAKMSFRNLDDLCPSWWGILAPLFLLGAEGEMIAADWKHGIFPRKTRSRPRYSAATRDASMAGRVTGRCWETLLFPAQWSWIRGAAGVGDGVRVRVGELLLLRSPVAPEEVRFALWTPHKSGDCWAERNTPTWSLSAGLPKQFHVTDLQTDAQRANGPPQDTDTRVHVGKFLLVVV